MKLIDIDLLELPKGNTHHLNLPKISLQEMESVKQYGILKPVIVVESDEKAIQCINQKYVIVSEIKSWQLAQKLNIHKVPAHIVKIPLGSEHEILNSYINAESKSHQNPLLEARHLQKLKLSLKLKSNTELASIVGSTRTAVSHKLRLLKLIPEVQKKLENGELKEGQARPLVTLEKKQQLALTKLIISKKFSVREIEQIIREVRGKKDKLSKKNNNTPTAYQVNATSLEQLITEKIGCTARIDQGKLIIDYYNDIDILEGILLNMGIRSN